MRSRAINRCLTLGLRRPISSAPLSLAPTNSFWYKLAAEKGLTFVLIRCGGKFAEVPHRLGFFNIGLLNGKKRGVLCVFEGHDQSGLLTKCLRITLLSILAP